MSYQIITRITITPDLRVMVRMAANNIRPLDFRYDEVVSLTETLRTKGRPTLELELLLLFFKGLWQGRTRYDRAVGYTLLTDGRYILRSLVTVELQLRSDLFFFYRFSNCIQYKFNRHIL